MPWAHGEIIYVVSRSSCCNVSKGNLSKLEKGRESSNSWMSRIVGNLTRLAIQRAAYEDEIVRKSNLLLSNIIILFFFILCYRSVRVHRLVLVLVQMEL